MAVEVKKITKDELDSDLDSGFTEEVIVTRPVGLKEQTPAPSPPLSPPPTPSGVAVHTVAPTAAVPGASPGSPEGKAGQPASAVAANEQNQQNDDSPVVLTKKTLDRLLASADGQVQLRAEIARLNGTVGGYKATIDRLTQGGELQIDENDVDWKEFTKDFPDIAKGTKKGLQAIAKKIGAGVAPGASEKAVQEAIAVRVLKLETDALEDEFPDWKKTLGDHPGAKTEFRAWLAKQPKDYHDRVQNTLSAAVISRAIRKFEASKKTTTQVPTPPTSLQRPAVNNARPANTGGVRAVIGRATRQDRLRGAITPRGDGGGSPGRRVEEDPMEAGFRQERS